MATRNDGGLANRAGPHRGHRNYRDAAPPVGAHSGRGMSFPGVLCYATSVRHSEAGHDVRALLEWMEAAVAAGRAPARNGIYWLRRRAKRSDPGVSD